MPMHDADYWIRTLRLEPHAEGGYFRRVYESAANAGPSHAATGIYYLLRDSDRSRLHRLKSEELWHFYAGGGLTLHMIHPGGAFSQVRLGPDPDAGQAFQAAVPPGVWFGATLDDAAAYALVGCTVIPGFQYSDFELADRDSLLRRHPACREIILRLT